MRDAAKVAVKVHGTVPAEAAGRVVAEGDWHRSTPEVQGVSLAAGLPLSQLADAAKVDVAMLDIARLRAILRKYGAFPNRYRLLVWRHLLQLPGNRLAYQALLDQGAHPAFAELDQAFELGLGGRHLGRLQRLLSSLAHWCPGLAGVDALPAVLFPWLLLFGADMLGAFEACATLLSNWTARLLECHPPPPIEPLASAEALLRHAAPRLHAHLLGLGVGPAQWGWPLLETLFCRVLAHDAWLALCDHLLTQEPPFVLLVLVAYVAQLAEGPLPCVRIAPLLLPGTI